MAPTSLVACPFCQYHFRFPATSRGLLATCPDCGQQFHPPGGPGSIFPDRRSASLLRDRKTYLTAPHPCHPGKHPIHKAFGHRQTTVRCEECLGTTSIYAAIYFCPCCVGRQTLLESPRSQWGQTTACPSCGSSFVVPNDDVLREIDPHRREGTWFSFGCPACDKALKCATRYAGSWVVCPQCIYAIQVPRGGFSEAAPARDVDMRRALQPVGSYACPQCGLGIPRGCGHCPHCRGSLTTVLL